MGWPTTVLAGVAVAFAVYCALDPFKHSPMANYPGFEVHSVVLPPLSKIREMRDPQDLLQRAEQRFLGQLQGPESIVFDSEGRGPYTGVADGRILFWDGSKWNDFAYTSPNRSEICDPKPSPMMYLKTEHICGRPLGLRLHKKTGDLYIADAYFGILKVGPEGGLATPLTTEAEGVKFTFTNDLDIDDEGNVYFSDSSAHFQRRNFMQLSVTQEPTGRILKYDPVTKETTVLVRNIQYANGVTLSKDGSFLVFSEACLDRLVRYWLKGEKAGTTDVFAVLPGFPDNVRTNEEGEFWVALYSRRTAYSHYMSIYPWLRKFVIKLPIKAYYHHRIEVGKTTNGIIVKLSPEGELLRVLEDREGKVVRAVSGVEERNGELWMGSVVMPFIAVYSGPK